MRKPAVSMLLIATVIMTLQLCLAQDVAQGKPTPFANQFSTQSWQAPLLVETVYTCCGKWYQEYELVVKQSSSAVCSEARPGPAGSTSCWQQLGARGMERPPFAKKGQRQQVSHTYCFYAAAGAVVADVPASNSSQEAGQATSTQVPPALAAAGTTAAEVLSQIPPLEGPIKVAVVLPVPPRYTANVTAQGSSVVDAVAPATHGPAVRVALQPTAVVADAVLEREAVPSTYQGILDKHNYYRAWHSAGPLSWSTALANSAAAFASQCTQGHDPYLSMNEGENLWMIGGPGSWSFLPRAVDEWCVWKRCQCTVACCCCCWLDRSVLSRWQLSVAPGGLAALLNRRLSPARKVRT